MQCPAPQILDLHYNATPPWSLSLPVCWCTGAPADSLLLSATCSKSQGHAIRRRLCQGLVGWVRVLGESWMLCWVGGILGVLIPHPLQKDTPIFFFLFYIGPTCKILSLTFGILFLTFFLFLTFVLNMVISSLHVYSFPLFPCFRPSRAQP